MSSPLPVTEDTPPDMLTGAMDLHVVLPNGQGMNMSVERTTPMMDLLVQVTTANKISPGGYVIRAIGEHGVLPYKPSTPIGALDTWTVHIVSKKEGTANSFVRKSSLQPKPVNQNIPFEQTFRLQVNLPRNQLYVSRVSYKTYLQDILREVCTEKNLDQTKYSLFNPENLGEPLDLSKTLNDYKLQRLSLASNSSQPVGLSSVDIMALKNYENGSQRVNNLYYTSHSYDGSVSSGSLEGRSLSPVRSDESSSSPTISKPSGLGRPPRKRRPAPKPPSSVNEQNGNCMSESLIISHSRNSSDSSGYHESSVLSESPESNTNSIANSLPRRSKLPCEDSYLNKHACIKSNLSSNGKAGNSLSRSLSNLAVSGNGKSNLLSRAMRRKEYSASSTSLSAISGKKKKAQAPPPPTTSKSLLSLKEEEAPDEVITNSVQEVQFSNVTSSQPTANSRCRNTSVQEAQKDTKKTAPIKPPENDSSFDAVDSVDTADSYQSAPCNNNHLQITQKELTMDDEEIDRIFDDATKDYEIPQPADTNVPIEKPNKNNEESSLNWVHKLPSPPQGFRNQLNENPIECSCVSISNCHPVITKTYNQRTNFIKESARVNIPKEHTTGVEYVTETYFHSTENLILKSPNCPTTESVSDIHFSCLDEPHNQHRNELKIGDAASFKLPPAMEDRLSLRILAQCEENSTFISTNDGSTNDSGLGSDDSIPSVSDNRNIPHQLSNESAPTKKPVHIRTNTLQNFTIGTYQNTKPVEIFHDDSVKTSRTTQIAKINRPFAYLSAIEKTTDSKSSVGVSRHSSFSTEKIFSSVVKRSTSHISLLSDNVTKFNRLSKLNRKSYSHSFDDADGYYEDGKGAEQRSTKWQNSLSKSAVTIPRLRRSTSELSINTECNREEEVSLELRDQFVKRSDAGAGLLKTQLQSVQVLKNILPKISRLHSQEKLLTGNNTIKFFDQGSVCDTSNREEFNKRSSLKTHYYPDVNVQSWNERPKRHVSIKTDRDYVFGNRAKTDSFLNNRLSDDAHLDKGEQESRLYSNHSNDLSRVPVRAVEFKKPFSPKPRHSAQLASSTSINDFEKPFGNVEQKQRPLDFYFIGEDVSANHSNENENSMFVPQRNMDSVTYDQNSKAFHLTHSNRHEDNHVTKKVVPNQKTHRRVESFTFKAYKTKLMENENICKHPSQEYKHYEVIFSPGLNNSRNKTFVNNCSTSEDLPKRHTLKENSNQMIIHSEFVTSKYKTVPSSVPVPPLSGCIQRKKFNQKSLITENPRENLLLSIKNFNKDNLRKWRLK